MARTIDITEKLGFGGRPTIVVHGKSIEVDDRAASLLKVMQLIGDGESVSAATLVSVYETLFDDAARAAIDALDLSYGDWQTLLFSAIDLATGSGDDEGNAATPATT